MRTEVASIAVSLCVGLGCGSGDRSFVAPDSTVYFSVVDQAESQVCQPPVTRESTCTVTITARVEVGELEGKEWHLLSLETVVMDTRGRQDLGANPRMWSADDIHRSAGSNMVAAHGHLNIPVEVRFDIGQPPFYIDGPHKLEVKLSAVVSAPASK
jgi:hypothetical protein